MDERQKVIDEWNAKGMPEKIPEAIDEVTKKYAHKTKIPNAYCYLEGEDMQAYLHDLKLCQQFASESRKKMADDILKHLKIRRYTSFETVHNFIDEDNIIRKGAIPAHAGQKVLIPMNMRDGCLICIGKGNPDWNESAPHGAGRLYKRSAVKDLFTLEEYQAEMQGVYTTAVSLSTLDESPMAYKPMEEIVRLIAPTVEIVGRMKPIYNFKAGE
jgi:RNA-splicing ligase RtcB